MVRLADLAQPEREHLIAKNKELAGFDGRPWVAGPSLGRRRVAIITTSGIHRVGDRPFGVPNDAENAAERGGVAGEKIRALWQFQTSPLFTPAERAALDLALAAGSCPPSVTEEHPFEFAREHLEQSGWTPGVHAK